MKKFLEQSLAFVASAGFVATAGLVYTTIKNVNLERELRKEEMVIKNRELDLKESQLELEKYKHNLPSKFETTPILDNKIKTPVSDVLNNKLESSKTVQELSNIKDTFNTDSPFEGSYTVPLETVQLTGVAVGCLTITVLFSLILIYLNNIITNYDETKLNKLPVFVKELVKLMKLNATLSNNLLYLLTLSCLLTIIALSVFLILL